MAEIIRKIIEPFTMVSFYSALRTVDLSDTACPTSEDVDKMRQVMFGE